MSTIRRQIRDRPRTIAIAALISSIGITGSLLWWTVLRVPTPREAAQMALGNAISGNVEWLWTNSATADRAIPKEVLAELFDTFLREPLEGSTVLATRTLYESQTMAVIQSTLRLKNGREVNAGAIGYVEDGKIVAPGFESLLILYCAVWHSEGNPTIQDQLIEVWKVMGPWLRARGVTHWYTSQGDYMVPIPES